MNNNTKHKKSRCFLVIIISFFVLISSYTFVNAETAKLNHENFNINFKNVNPNDEILIILENYSENFSDTRYNRIKVIFKNNKIIKSYEEDYGIYMEIGEDTIVKHTYNIKNKTSLSQKNEIVNLKIKDLSPNKICLAVNDDFQVSVYRNNKEVMKLVDFSFDDKLFHTDGYNRYYYSNIELDMDNLPKQDRNSELDEEIIETEESTPEAQENKTETKQNLAKKSILQNNYIYIGLIALIAIVIIIINAKRKKQKTQTMS